MKQNSYSLYIIRTEDCLAKAVTDFSHLYDIPKETKYPGKPESMASVPFFKKILYNYFTMNYYFPGLKITLKARLNQCSDIRRIRLLDKYIFL